MGITCQSSQSCYKSELDRQNIYKRQRLKGLNIDKKISGKDLVKIKKYPISKDYVIGEQIIGKGSFGSVYRAVNKQSEIVFAAKKVVKEKGLNKVLEQVFILKQLDHPNIIRIIDVYEEELVLYIVSEMCSGGELFNRIVDRKSINQRIALNYMQQLLSAVSYCHMKGIIHRDLKPQNIVLISQKDDNLKIIDFGGSMHYKKEQKKNTIKIGSVYYIAPQVLKKNYNQKCDIWSLGVIFYMMMSGSPPFNGKCDNNILEKILLGKYQIPIKKFYHVSQDAKNLMNRMLEYDPEKRISAKQALQHPWIRSSKSGDRNLYIMDEFSLMNKFCAMSNFKQHIATYIIHNLTTAEQIQKLKQKFRKMDINNDGRISWNQFSQSYRKTISNKISDKQLKIIFEKLDKNQSGYIDYSQFVTSMMSNQLMESKKLIQVAFDMMDLDKNGVLDKQELLLALGSNQQNIYYEMLNQCRVFKNGKIGKNDFINALLSLSENKIENDILPCATTREQS